MAASRKIVPMLAAILLCATRCLGSRENGKASSPLTFTHHLYNTTINENSAPRTYVQTTVKMGIKIADVLWDIKYKVVSGDDDGIFQAESVKVGNFNFLRIKTRSSDSALLNREVRDTYALTVEATESTFDFQTKTKVFVQVLDMNDLKPLFYPASYNVVIREDTPLQSSVVTVSATDADMGSNAKFYYSFTLRAHPFIVDPFTGTVRLYKKLNHTRAGQYDLTVLAEDRTKKISGVQKFGNVAKVTVNVQKTSLGVPVITVAPKPTISADGKITIDVHVEAKVKPVESLHIVGGDPHKCFEIIPLGLRGSDFQVVSTKRIIWPKTPFGLNLSLQAKDRSFPSLLSPVTRIHVPAYDYTPLSFLEDTYIATLSEYSPVKTHVLKVSISSSPQDVTFSIKNNPDSAKFMISTKTGIIITTGKFDYESKSRYEFDVVANHGAAETHVVVEIKDENDNSPQFKRNSYEASVDENSPVGSSILRVIATDKDKGKNGFVTYAIADLAPLPFTIDPFTGIISTSEHMDYEVMKRRYHLRVWASDSGTPFSRVSECPVTITLNNINDNFPLFEKVDCNATVPADTQAGHTVVELSAIDSDELEQLRYVIESGNELQLFTIDSVSGSITLKQPLPKGASSFTLIVVASDGKHRSEASIVRITVVNKGEDATQRCHETGIYKQLTDKLIESIKPVLNTAEDETFSDGHITNRYSPKFDQRIPSSVDVPENHPLITKIVSIKATDEDTGFNSMPVYVISSGNEDGCFTIDTFSGLLQLVCPLDRELKEFYILNITAYDLGTPQRAAWVLLAVNVIDVNDNPPKFDQPRHVVRIPENTDVDSVIFTARAVDADTGTSGTFQYTLVTSTDMFRVDELTGEVVLTGLLDRETLPRHDLLIQAREKSHLSTQLFSTLELVVVLQDINDNPPKFVPKVYKIKVLEDIPVGTLLLWVESIDLDLGSGGLVTYNLKNTENEIFHLDSSTGALTLEKELDYERRVSYNLTVRAVDHGQPRSLSSSCFVEIEVLDVNENLHRPVFSEFVYDTAVMEDAVVGTSVVTLTASDKDLGRDGVVRYHVHEGSGLGVFTIDEETGVIRTKEVLDRETEPHYWLSVYVTDLGTEPLVSWTHVFLEVVDVNDNAPELSRPIYFASVPENVPRVVSVIKVSATDLDTISENKLSFQILPSHQTYFNIDAKTGVISTVSALDREEKPEHSIEVIVSDNGSPPLHSTATVVIKVLDDNDNEPKFTEKRVHIQLPAPNLRTSKLEVCRMIAGDADEGPNAAVTYKMHPDQDRMFEIDPVTGMVTSHGDFLPGNYSILSVKATDQGSSPKSSTARLDIEWIAHPPPSDEPITFDDPQFTFAVMETEPITYMVGIIRTETHRQRWFDIVGGDEDKDFDIHRNTGAISIARRLNAARCSNYNLTVRVTDGHQTATTQAYIRVVDVNEHRPVFLKRFYEVIVPEDTAPWKDILHISAQDEDGNSRLVFSIQSSLHPKSTKFFHLDPKSGVLVMTEALDYEALSVHTLIVMVSDQGIPVKRNFAKVVIHVEDCNDHSPTFLSPRYEASISNLAPTGSEVIRVTALDKDTGSNADIRYSLHSGNNDNMFSIDPLLGSISPSKPLDLQPPQQFHLTVKATDQGFPQRSDICSVHLLLHVSAQTPPAFPSDEYLTEVSESSTIGTSVVTIFASSPAAVQYGIETGNQDGVFHINPSTGLISVQKHLDFERQASYQLKVTASTTAGALSRTSVYIYVNDENDNAPVFEQQEYLGEISESAPVNTMVIQEKNIPLVVKAVDVDKDMNSLLVYEILDPEATKIFKIDPNMGTITLISPVDFESKAEYEFFVQAKDSGEPSLYTAQPAKVTVRVLDLNDCPPRFTNSSYEASIIFPAVTDAEVVRVTADDPDSAVTYSIAEGNLLGAFSIQPNTGVVTVSNTSDFRHFYQLVVKASDGLYNTLAFINVNVTNFRASNLRFEHKLYSASVMENLKTVKVLAALKPIGCFLNEPLLFSLVNPMGRFSVSPTSGILETTGIPFDREERDVYDVLVKLQDMRTPARTATALVKVFINDVNDNTPHFLNLPFSTTVSEDLEPGDVLYQVTATDRDMGENGAIMYTLEEDYDLFRIHPDEGDISLQRPLDFEALNKYVLTVWAKDEGNPSQKTSSELSIQVRNRTNPVFQTLVYPLRVPENVSPSTTILHVQARNPEGYRLVYNLEDENATKHFHMDFKTGVLTVAKHLDYESQTKHVLTVRASDSVTGVFSEASIEIEVDDVNDNAPVFSKPNYSADIAEGLPIGTSVLQVSASDLDSGRNKDLTFQLVGMTEEEAQLFKIEPNSGLIVTKGVLDHESRNTFNLKVRVTDNGTVSLSSEVTVFVNVTDINDNPPDFVSSLYEANLDEMAKCGHIVVKIQASDRDISDVNNLKYKILSGNEDRYFNINESSGIISFSNVCKRNLDPYYNLTVAVSDGVFQKKAPVNIDMINSNRHSPYFKQSIYEAELAENSDAGTRVIRLAAIDPDDGPYGSVDYTIINKLAEDKFDIDNEGHIITRQPLDRENPTQRVIAIKVMAKDGGGKVAFCTVKIILTDENDNVPQFKASEYQVSIQSTVNKGSPVIKIMAYDADDGKNADVTYNIDEGEEVTEDIIEINPFTGVVNVKESLVGMENKIFHFKVKARDGSFPFYNSTVPVQVKVVPPEVPLPKFSEPLYTFSAAEDVPVGTEIGSIKANSDMPLIYSLVNGNTVESNKDKVFSMDQESGTLVLQRTIDHEKTKWYQIDVIAQGNHNGTDVASLVSVSIQVQDVNDNHPMFDASPYRAFLAENMPAGTTVIQVTANDPDTETNGLVTYSLEPLTGATHGDDITEVFSIDGDSGWITTMHKTDCEVNRVYKFNVMATDHGSDVKLSSSVLVEVTVTDENDNPPKFSSNTYHGSVMENSIPGEVIVSMSTTDADVSLENRLVTCYITDGDPLGQFAIIQEDEGKWGLIVKEPLDRESKEKYTLKITATDGKFETPVTVEVRVQDVNDNSPVCEQLRYKESVMENSAPNMFVLVISASDPDLGANGQISYTLHGADSHRFHLDRRTGKLSTLAVLDREDVVEYNMVAKATDGGGLFCQVSIHLLVQDTNDNPPRFSSSHYPVTMFDNTTVRTPITVLYAKDPDTGVNSEVKYSILSGDGGYFAVDEFSGVVRLERPLTTDTPSTFELKVKATDRGFPRNLNSVATVTVDVVSLDDYQPVFLNSEYSAQLLESLAVGSEVLSVSALIRDGGGPDPVVYRIVAGNEDKRFHLHPRTGSLTLIAPLDFEISREFYLSVEGSRGKSTLSDITTVIINVTDVNDNAPVFLRGANSAEILENMMPGSLVMKVIASDKDGPVNNLLRYSIVSGDPLQQFTIHPRSGEITVCAPLDREEIPHYSLTVQAADEGEPPLSSAVLLTITVTDVNDNPPVFSQVNHSLLLQEGESVGSSFLQLVVTDKDTPKNGPPFSFHIISGNEDRRFQVDQGGLLSLSAPLKKKVKPRHQLKIQVTDSGHPPLSSICVININVTEQSKYPPTVVPLEVFITTAGGMFANRVIGRLHASDQDLQDVLTYKLMSDNPTGGRFSVDQADGKIWADENLEEGFYSLNVSVTDGKFSVWTGVKVHVWAATQRVLDSGVTLQLVGMTPEEFLGDHWRGLQRNLGQVLGLPRQELHLASLQTLPNTKVLEVLLIWRPVDGSVSALPTSKLAGIISDIEDSLDRNLIRVHHNGCLGSGCPRRGCRNGVRLQGERLSHYTTARAGFITPQHTWESVCPCNESAVQFDDKSYLRYLHSMDEDTHHFTLSLQFKTFREDGLIMLANSTDWGILQLIGGALHFNYRCEGVAPGRVTVMSASVSDGLWHTILLEVNSTSVRLTLDQQHVASSGLSQPCRMMRSHGALLFASVPQEASEKAKSHPRGFIGCLEKMELNGEPIRVGDAAEWSEPGYRRVFGVYQCCSTVGACDSNPCQHRGVCEQDTSGEPRCRCTGLFHGARCELTENPCASQPCTNGRVCVPKGQGYMCSCSLDDPDARCHNRIDVCLPNSCPRGFKCQASHGSFYCDPMSQMAPEFGYVEILEIAGSILGLLLIVAIFVCIRKRYVQQRNKKPARAEDSNGYLHTTKKMKPDQQEVHTIELTSLMGPVNDLDHTPFRSLRPRSQIISAGGVVSSHKTLGPVVCSVAPNLPARPPSSSDNDSIRKSHWDQDYEVYPADPDYYGRPTVHEFPQFDIVEDTYSSSTIDSRRNSRFGGFPFPLDRCDRRAPLPPCYSNQNLDDFLGPDGLPLPKTKCPNEYTAISYYPTQQTRSLDNVSVGHKRLSMRLSVAMPSYAEQPDPPPPQKTAQPQTRPVLQNLRSYDGSSMVESDYGSCEEVMF